MLDTLSPSPTQPTAGMSSAIFSLDGPDPVTEAQRGAARFWYWEQFDIIDHDVLDEIDAIEARDPDGLVRLHQSAMRKDAAIAAEASTDTLSPFPHRRASSSAPASAASSTDDVFPSSPPKAPRAPLPLAMISRDEWVHPFEFADNDHSRGPSLLAVVALGCTSLSVFGVFALAFALIMGWL